MDQGFSASGGAVPSATHASRGPRRAVGLDAHLHRGTGVIVPVTIRDLSYSGCKVATAEAFAEGETMALSVPGRGRINVTVRWSEGREAGLEFEPEPASRDAEVKRASERILAHAEVTVRKPGGPMWTADVADVSPEGCRIGWVSRPRPGDAMWIKFDGLEAIGADVCWVEGRMAGLKFVRPIHPAVFDLLAARLQGE